MKARSIQFMIIERVCRLCWKVWTGTNKEKSGFVGKFHAFSRLNDLLTYIKYQTENLPLEQSLSFVRFLKVLSIYATIISSRTQDKSRLLSWDIEEESITHLACSFKSHWIKFQSVCGVIDRRLLDSFFISAFCLRINRNFVLSALNMVVIFMKLTLKPEIVDSAQE